MNPPRPDYGIDAPLVLRRLIGLGIASLALAFVAVHFASEESKVLTLVAASLNWAGAGLLVCAAAMLWGSQFGKFRMRDRVTESIPWRGDERVLDVGCGHGLLLIAAAKRLKTGKAVGLDIWSQTDQARNRPEAPVGNARIEGVADRLEVVSADARALPLHDMTFDVVLSSLTLHNISPREDREKAMREIVRVLKPGGRVGLFDIHGVREYARVFRECGMESVRVSAPNVHLMVPVRMLTARKPAPECRD
jgi:SAM-dependent methyltransferase